MIGPMTVSLIPTDMLERWLEDRKAWRPQVEGHHGQLVEHERIVGLIQDELKRRGEPGPLESFVERWITRWV